VKEKQKKSVPGHASPRKHTDTQKKQTKSVPVCASPRKHTDTQAKQKKDKHPKRVVELETEEFQGIEDIDAEGVKPMIRLPKYIPSQNGKAQVMKDSDTKNFTVSTPMLPKQVPFEVPRLARIPLLKMEDWDLVDHAKFPHLAMDKYMWKVYYEETGVTTLETREWVRSVEQLGLLNLLWVPHDHRTPINMICVHQLLTLVHNGCLWLGQPIPITDMLIHKITQRPYKGVNPAKEFGGKTGEKYLAEKMKKDYGLLKKS